MVSTVTTTTVSTIATAAMVGSLGLIAVITLLALLIQKELIGVSEGPRSKILVRALNIAIAPLLMGFALSMAVKVAEALQ